MNIPNSRRRRERPTPIVEIREIELEDLPAVFHLGERIFTADRSPTLYRTWDEYELVEFFSSDGETCLVAEVAGQVVGFALGTLIEKRRSAWTYGYLIWLGVDPAFSRLGLGTRLLRRLKEIFIEFGARMMLVDTAADNDSALRFFRSAGFGNESEHVYLTRNLTRDREYIRHRTRRDRPTAVKRPPPGAPSVPLVPHDELGGLDSPIDAPEHDSLAPPDDQSRTSDLFDEATDAPPDPPTDERER